MRLSIGIVFSFFFVWAQAQIPLVGSGRQVYSPDQVDSLFYWFDAQDAATITTTNNKVTAWNDKSGNGYHVLQADTSKAPTYSTTAGPGGNTAAMVFDGIDDFLASAAHWWGSDDITVFVVMKFANATRDAVENFVTRFYPDRQFAYLASNASVSYRNQVNNWQNSTLANTRIVNNFKHTNYKVHAWVTDGAGNWTLHSDGSSVSLTDVSNGGDGTVQDSDGLLYLGANSSDNSTFSNFLQGYISEIIVFSRALTNAERQGIEAYLSSKYDLPLENKQKQPVISNRRIQPDYVDSLFYWFDATDASTITTNNNKVTQWADKGPFGYDVVQADTSKAPTYSATSGPGGTTAALTFDGTDDFLASASHWWGSDDLTIFVVMKFGNATRDASEVICGVYTSGGGISWLFTSGPTSLSYVLRPGWGSDGLTILTPTFSAKSTTYRSIAWAKDLLDGTDNTSPIDAYVDGSSQSVSPSTGINITSIFNQSVTPFSIAAGNITTTPSGFLQGSISEIIVFSRALTTSERRGIENYLNEKYNLW